ncbi:MAG: SIS domain-containing protein, partial [Bacteroidetes bacterium]|nr:SIS domain-containing protein [Bacteroidota bacterium]
GNNSIITAIGNDYSFEDIFSRELMALGMKGDVFVPISTSGNSKNILKAIKTAKSLGIETFGLTGGSGGSMISLCPCFCVPSKATPRIQEAHIMIGHIICEMVETKKYNEDTHLSQVSISRPAFSALTPELS